MSRRRVATWGAVLTFVVSIWPARAHASEPPHARRVVVLQVPAALDRALRTALVPWGMRVARPAAGARPAPPRNVEQAQRLARQLRADALIWLAVSSRRHELWLYDRASDSLSARPVPAPPFDETRAAALALSVKTDLRTDTASAARGSDAGSDTAASNAARERGAARSASAASAPGKEAGGSNAASASVDRPVSMGDDARVAEPGEPGLVPSPRAELDAPGASAGSPGESASSRLRLLLHAAARVGARSLDGAEGRYAIEARWAPRARRADAAATLWLAARLDLGLPAAVDTPLFDGEYSELGGGVGVGANVHLVPWLELGLQLGIGGFHVEKGNHDRFAASLLNAS